jgi:hypothetical protein
MPSPWRSEPWSACGQQKWELHRGELDQASLCRAPMAEIVDASIEVGETYMKPASPSVSGAAPSRRKPPVRVKLQRMSCEYGQLHPPQGSQGPDWWEALKVALGTCSNAFVYASLCQLQAAARLPDGPVSETAMNAALALIEAVAPKNEIEGTLAVQMAATHSASMAVLSRIGSAHSGYRLITAYSNAASKLLRAYTAQVDALRRLRGGGAQHIRVEHRRSE